METPGSDVLQDSAHEEGAAPLRPRQRDFLASGAGEKLFPRGRLGQEIQAVSSVFSARSVVALYTLKNTSRCPKGAMISCCLSLKINKEKNKFHHKNAASN